MHCYTCSSCFFSTKVRFTSYLQHVDTPLCVHQHGAPHANLASASLLWYRWQSYVYFSKYAKQSERKFYKVICWLSHRESCRPKAQLLITPLYNEPVASLLSLFIKNDKGKNEQKKLAKAIKPAVTAIPTTFFYPKPEAC